MTQTFLTSTRVWAPFSVSVSLSLYKKRKTYKLKEERRKNQRYREKESKRIKVRGGQLWVCVVGEFLSSN